MSDTLFAWTPARYALLAAVVLPLLAAIGGSILWAWRRPALHGYPILAGITALMFPFVAMFVGLHVFWPEGFKKLPEFMHLFYDRTLHLQREHLPAFVGHAVAGMTLWFFWLVQFHPRARMKYPRLHRWTGRLYLLVMIPFLLTALHIMNHTPAAPMTWRSLIVIQSTLTVLTAALALRAILQGRTVEHQRWMVRNAAVLAQTFFMRIYLMVLTLFTQDVGDILTASHALGFITSLTLFAWYFEPRYLPSQRESSIVGGVPARKTPGQHAAENRRAS